MDTTAPGYKDKLLRIYPPMLADICRFWHETRLPSESAAIRRLIARGLAAEMEEKATEAEAA
jgi:hypothetical protein